MRANNRSTMRKGGMGDISPEASNLGEGEKGQFVTRREHSPKRAKQIRTGKLDVGRGQLEIEAAVNGAQLQDSPTAGRKSADCC